MNLPPMPTKKDADGYLPPEPEVIVLATAIAAGLSEKDVRIVTDGEGGISIDFMHQPYLTTLQIHPGPCIEVMVFSPDYKLVARYGLVEKPAEPVCVCGQGDVIELDAMCAILNVMCGRESADLADLKNFASRLKKLCNHTYVDISGEAILAEIQGFGEALTLTGNTMTWAGEPDKFRDRDFLNDTINGKFPKGLQDAIRDAGEPVCDEKPSEPVFTSAPSADDLRQTPDA